MNAERVQLRGRLAEAIRTFERLDVTISSDVIRLRQLIDPFEDDAGKLNVEEAKVVMDRLYENVHLLRATQETITKLKGALGEA